MVVDRLHLQDTVFRQFDICKSIHPDGLGPRIRPRRHSQHFLLDLLGSSLGQRALLYIYRHHFKSGLHTTRKDLGSNRTRGKMHQPQDLFSRLFEH